MNLREIYVNTSSPVISFEVFPPKGEGAEYTQKVQDLFVELRKLKSYNPSLISVTYGAGGSTRDKTFDLVLKIKKELQIEPMAHFTCVGFNKIQILDYVKTLEQGGIKNILALRGDAPAGMDSFRATKDGFSHANELVAYLKQHTDISIAVAGYPEKHPEAVDFQTDINNLKNKVNAGGEIIYTQLFFDNNDYYTFVEKAQKNAINVPVIPGIMIIQSISQIDRIITLSGSKIPKSLKELIEKHKNNPESVKQIGIEYAIQQVQDLISNNVKGLHFYPLNKSYAVSKVLDNI